MPNKRELAEMWYTETMKYQGVINSVEKEYSVAQKCVHDVLSNIV